MRYDEAMKLLVKKFPVATALEIRDAIQKDYQEEQKKIADKQHRERCPRY